MQADVGWQKAAGCLLGEGSHEETNEIMDVFTLLVVLMVLRSLPMESSTSNPHSYCMSMTPP